MNGPTDEAPQIAERATYQTVRVAGGLSARLPQEFDRWTWAGDTDVTLVLATRQGQLVALIYAEAFSDLAEGWASIESYRFQRTVAPQLASAALPLLSIPFGFLPQEFADSMNLPRPPPRLVEAIIEQTELNRSEVMLALDRLTTRTLGRGLGVRGPAKTFTGWKWIGRNQQDTKVRLGRYNGNWSGQEELDEPTRKVLDFLAESSPRIAELRVRINREPFFGSPSQARGSAMLVLGDIIPPAGRGVHLAIVCQLEPACPVEEALADFLSSLKPAGGETLRAGGGASIAELGDRLRQAGLDLELESPIRPSDLLEVANNLPPPPPPAEEENRDPQKGASAEPGSGQTSPEQPEEPVEPKQEDSTSQS